MNAQKILFFLMLLNFDYSFCIGQDSRVIETGVYRPTKSDQARKYYNDANKYKSDNLFFIAISLYKKAIAEDSSYVDAYDNLGLCFRKMNMLDSATKYYLISQKIYPEGIVAIQNLAVVEKMKGDFEKSKFYYNKIIQMEPENPEGYYGLSYLNWQYENYNEALNYGKLAEKYYRIMNNPYIQDCYRLMYSIYMKINDKVQAQKYLDLIK